jgi:hypothetical protein
VIVMEVYACLILILCRFPVFSTLRATRLLRKCKRVRRPIFFVGTVHFRMVELIFFLPLFLCG